MTRVLYLHGFASSPSSSKARYFHRVLEGKGLTVEIPDLAAGDFEHLTITGQLAVLEKAAGGNPAALVGSSMGGYLAALYAAAHPEVSRLVLMAPAFGFAQRWPDRLGPAQMEEWRRAGVLSVYHYGEQRMRDLAFDLMHDAGSHPPFPDFRQPALIFHGDHDDIVPPEYSRQFAATHPNARLEILDAGHDLLNQLEYMGSRTADFL